MGSSRTRRQAGLLVAALGVLSQVSADELRAPRSIWDGVFTEAQAARGQVAYTGPCSHCHGYKLDGAPDDPDMFSTPPLAGAKFLRDWEGRSLAVLYAYTRATMPESNPGFLSDQEFIDIIAYILVSSGVPAGDRELPANTLALAPVVIEQR